MKVNSEKISTRFLEINNCNFQEISHKSIHTVRENGRVDYYALYILEGCCYVKEEGVETRVEAGNLLFYKPGERQEYRFDKNDRSVTAFVHFSGTAVEEILDACGFSGRRVVFIGDGKPARVMRDLVEEFCLKKPFFEEQTAALLLHFFSVSARRASYHEEGVNVGLQHSVDEVLRYMHAHVGENHDVAFYAAMCHLSEGRFAHLFKGCTGTSPKRYVTGIKVETALRLLSTTNLSLQEVAEAVGIEDVNYFSRLVKKHTGKTPGTWR